MKSTGIRRKVDDLGRVVIPAGVRRSLGIREGDELEVSVEGEQVVLAKPADHCVFCGSPEQPLEAFRGRRLCRACVTSVAMLADRTARGETEPARAWPEWAPPPADREPLYDPASTTAW